MATIQPGILAQGTRIHHHLEYDLVAGAADEDVAAAVARLREPAVTAGGANLVVGFAWDLWRRLAADDAPDDGGPFAERSGPAGTMPSTQHDLWVWIHGTGTDVALDTARAVSAALAGVATLADEQPAFVYRDSRDLTGFVDGTENPPLGDAPEVVGIPEGAPGAGGTHAILQRWVHDLEAFHALGVEEQERVFGRTKPDSVELDDAHKPADAHIARVVIDDENGEELEIYRRSTAYGDVRTHGLMFVAFSRDPARFAAMMDRMVGSADGLGDRLLRYSRPVTGAAYVVPSLEALTALGG